MISRAVLALMAGSLALAGCAGTGGSDGSGGGYGPRDRDELLSLNRQEGPLHDFRFLRRPSERRGPAIETDPEYQQYLQWKQWQEFKRYQEWKQKQGESGSAEESSS